MKALLLVSSLVMNTFSFAQNKVYANGQESLNVGLICGGCAVVNPNGAVGSNEDDYSLIKTDVGLLAGVEQVLYFPQTTNLTNLIIGIGTDDEFPISAYLDSQLLSLTSVETYYEQNGFQTNKVTQNVNRNSIKIDSQKKNRATIEITPSAAQYSINSYNRVKISVRGILGLAHKLRIYYAYYKNVSKCNPPVNPIHYYSFNEDTSDHSGSNVGFPLHATNNRNPVYKDSMVCKQGLSYQVPKDSTYTLSNASNLLPVPQPKKPRTVSFWARVDQGGSIDVTLYGEKIRITKDSITIRPVNENHNFDKNYFGRMSRVNPTPADGSFNFYTLNFTDDPTPAYGNNLYQNISPFHPPYYPVDLCLSINGVSSSIPYLMGVNNHGFPTTISCTHWAPYYTGKYDNTFSITLNKAQLDEFLIYDKKMPAHEFFNAYNAPQTGTQSIAVTNKQTVIENDILTVSPNPTTGSITLDGNILLLDADISIRNISGKEVHRTRFTSKTFELPSSLLAGVYMISVQTRDKKVYTRKVILTR